jgi:hypothetical protein
VTEETALYTLPKTNVDRVFERAMTDRMMQSPELQSNPLGNPPGLATA